MLEENRKLKEQAEILIEANLWEEYERKRENLVAYGIKGTKKAENIRQVVKSFMIENLKLEKEWVDKLPIKSTITLQSNGIVRCIFQKR